MKRLKILVWHIHGGYLNALGPIEHDWYLPVKPGRPEGYGGRGRTFDMPAWVREVPAERVRELDLDLILYQTPNNLFEGGPEILSPAQQALPAIYLEHNTPRPHPVDTRHPAADHAGQRLLIVHVTHFNRLMWDNGDAPTMVVEHSVAIDPEIRYDGSLATGITVANNMQRRPRITGFDLFLQARESVPLTAAGMATEAFGGIGDIPYRDLHSVIAPYRFLFSPMRYTSLPLAVIEAMTIGMPVVALATTELPTVIEDGGNGFISCDPDVLIERMRLLLSDPALAHRMGERARETAIARFGMERFARNWNRAFVRAIELAGCAGQEQIEGYELAGSAAGAAGGSRA
jgi:hypothetical protein